MSGTQRSHGASLLQLEYRHSGIIDHKVISHAAAGLRSRYIDTMISWSGNLNIDVRAIAIASVYYMPPGHGCLHVT